MKDWTSIIYDDFYVEYFVLQHLPYLPKHMERKDLKFT